MHTGPFQGSSAQCHVFVTLCITATLIRRPRRSNTDETGIASLNTYDHVVSLLIDIVRSCSNPCRDSDTLFVKSSASSETDPLHPV
jgi:hypothetical protein